MKCIKDKSGTIRRVMDFQARTLVDLGLASYVSKEDFKAQESAKRGKK